MTTLLSLRELDVHYGAIHALRSVSLDVAEGEIVTLIGANGAGKSTTLRAISGMLTPTKGEITFLGAGISGKKPHTLVAQGLCHAPEGRGIFPNLTVRENLELGAYLHRDGAAMRETLADVVELFPRLGERMRQEGGTLSGGEQQMLAIGRAMMARPQLLLLDEPSLGIAPKLVQQIFAAIRAIAEGGVTVLLVEQNTRLALATSQRAYVLRTGEIALEGSSQDLATRDEIKSAYLGA